MNGIVDISKWMLPSILREAFILFSTECVYNIKSEEVLQ